MTPFRKKKKKKKKNNPAFGGTLDKAPAKCWHTHREVSPFHRFDFRAWPHMFAMVDTTSGYKMLEDVRSHELHILTGCVKKKKWMEHSNWDNKYQ